MMKKGESITIVFSLSLLLIGGYLVMNSLLSKQVNKIPNKITNTPSKRNIINSEKKQLRSIAQNNKPKKIDPLKIRSKINSKDIPSQEKIQLLEKCYQQEGLCGFPQTDSKAEYFAIGEAIKKELLKVHHSAIEEGKKSAELEILAQQSLRNSDGHVKEAALHLLTTQNPSLDSLREILNSIISYHDAQLIPLAMLELRRYRDTGHDDLIDRSLMKALRTGSPLVSEEISKHLSPFISDSNYMAYQNLLESLSRGSRPYTNLKNTLDDFKKQNSAASFKEQMFQTPFFSI